MAILLSEQFLHVHPATQAWWQRRERCESCKHCTLREGHEGEGVMRCKMLRQGGAGGAGYCIDARDEEGPCGPQARLYEPKR